MYAYIPASRDIFTDKTIPKKEREKVCEREREREGVKERERGKLEFWAKTAKTLLCLAYQ